MTLLKIYIPVLAQCQAVERGESPLHAALCSNGVRSLAHNAQNAMLRMHLMSNGTAGAVLGAILYVWLTQRGVSDHMASLFSISRNAPFIDTLLGFSLVTLSTRGSPQKKSIRSSDTGLIAKYNAPISLNEWPDIRTYSPSG